MKRSAFLLVFALLAFPVPPVSAQSEAAAIRIPDEVMNAEFESVTGASTFRLGSGKDPVIVVALWASWCLPCRFVITALNDIKKDFKFRGIRVIGLTTEDPVTGSEVCDFLNEGGVNFSIGWLDAARGKILMGGRDAIPQVLVLASDGTINKRFIGWNEPKTLPLLREALEEALIKPAPK